MTANTFYSVDMSWTRAAGSTDDAVSNIINNLVPVGTQIAPYKITQFEKIKDQLIKSKLKLDKFYFKDQNVHKKKFNEIKHDWEYFWRLTDLYFPLKSKINDIVRPKNSKIITNAWCKYWELFLRYDLIGGQNEIKAFFNAELPGAALCAIDYMVKTKDAARPFQWWGASYFDVGNNSHNRDYLNDSFGLFAKWPSQWLMSDTNNGDATKIKNLREYEQRIGPNSPVGGVTLYSHDAGLDVSSDFSNQELLNAHLHLGCAIAGLVTLRRGGNFIAKQYTFFETFTWNLLLIYASMFETFIICKPVTSRQSNSEIYLIGKNFLGADKKIMDVLMDRLENFHTGPILRESIVYISDDKSTKEKKHIGPQLYNLFNFARQIYWRQITMIDNSIYVFDNSWKMKRSQIINKIKNESNEVVNKWLIEFPVSRPNYHANYIFEIKK